jgi:Protein of unknown function (DUF3037)
VTGLAFYALVRYVPDLDAQEPINVGVVVTQGSEIEARFVPERVGDEESDVVRRFADLLQHLINEQQAPGDADGQAFVAELAFRRFSHFQITEPRQALSSEGLETLLTELSQWLEATPRGVPQLV